MRKQASWRASHARLSIGYWGVFEGIKVFEEEASGNTLRFYAVANRGRPLANGVYLYVVRVRGFDGREYVSEVRKFVILR